MSLNEEILKKLNKIYGKYMATQGLPVWGTTTPIAQNGYQILLVDGSGKLYVNATIAGSPTVDVIDRWTRQLGEIDIERYLGSAIGLGNPLHSQVVYGGAVIDPRSIRALTSSDDVTAYGSQSQALLQRATTYDLLVQLRTAGTEYDARQIRALTSADVVSTVESGSWTVAVSSLPSISGSVDVIDRAARLLGVVYGSQAQQLQQKATSYDLYVAIRQAGSELSASNPIFDSIVYGGAVIDPRSIRALTSSDVVSVNNFANPLPTLVQYPSGTTINPQSIRALTSSDIVTSLINYPSGTLIDPRSIRALTSSDIVTAYGSIQALLQRASTYELLTTLRQSGSELSASNPIFSSIVYSSAVIDPRSIRALTSSDVVTAYQTTRTNLTVMPERQDLISYGVAITVSTGGTPVQVLAASGTTQIKIYDVDVAHTVLSSLVYFYFGTSTTPTTRIFGYGESSGITNATYTWAKTFVMPRISNASDALYLYASVAGTYYVDLNYKQE